MMDKVASATPALYRRWSADLREVERNSLSRIDASSWVQPVVSMLATEEATPIRAATEGQTFYLRQPSVAERPVIRLLRYLSSERFFGLLLSAPLGQPFARFAKRTRADELNRLYATLAEDRIPGSKAGRASITFDNWLALALSAGGTDRLCPSTVTFIRREAELLADRDFINALKHGRAITAPGALADKIGVTAKLDGENDEELIPASHVVAVEDWVEKDGRFDHAMHLETFDMRAEVQSFYVIQIMTKAIVRSRLAVLAWLSGNRSEQKVHFDLPNDVIPTEFVARYKNLPASFGETAP